MTCAVYARKSTGQTGIADEQMSVARQVEHAKEYASRKGWTVDDSRWGLDRCRLVRSALLQRQVQLYQQRRRTGFDHLVVVVRHVQVPVRARQEVHCEREATQV
jgi:hypothetical protein